MRRSLTVLTVAAAAALALTGVAAPAAAASFPVTTLTELNAALADCTSAPNYVTITADILAPVEVITVGCDTTIDLNSRNVSVRSVIIEAGVELVVTGPAGENSGVLTADASSTTLAGIRTTGATLRVTGGTVHATGGVDGAGIGGDGRGASGGTLIVEGGAVSAVGLADYGSAIGGARGASSSGGNGGTVTVTGGSLEAYTPGGYTTTIGGGDGTPGGAGATISVTGGSLKATSEGIYATTIGGGGTFRDVTGPGGKLSVGPAGLVTLVSVSNSFASVFGPGIAISNTTQGAPGTLVVDGILRVESGVLRLPTGTSAKVGVAGQILGSVANPTTSATIVGPGTIANNGVVALEAPAASVTGNNRLLTLSTGSPSSVRVFGPSLDAGYRALPSPPIGTAWNTSTSGTGTWFTGTTSTGGSGTTALFPAGPGSLQLSSDPADFIATAGAAFTFPVTVLDSLGAVVSPQPVVTYTSDDCDFTDVGVFEVAGECSITAAAPWGPFALETEFTINVVPGAPVALQLTPSTTTVVAGTSVEYAVTAVDAYGNTSPARDVSLASSVLADTIVGTTVTPATVATRTITASIAASTSATGSATLVATVGPAATLKLVPSTKTIAQGGTVTFTVTATDANGNTIENAEATLTSSVPTDIVRGLSVTFPHASPHTITATIGDARAAVTIEVTATPITTGGTLSSTGGGELGLPLGLFALFLIAAGAIAIRVSARRKSV